MVEALANLRPGGRLVINAIRKEDSDKDELLRLQYEKHLWMEREIKTVANVTQFDIREFLPLAAEIPIEPVVETYRLEDANRALCELKRGPVRGERCSQCSKHAPRAVAVLEINADFEPRLRHAERACYNWIADFACERSRHPPHN